MSKALKFLDEFLGFTHNSPSSSSIHKATHSLVHKDAQRAAQQHADTFRLALQDKGLSKTHLKHIVSRAKTDTYMKHYRKTYVGMRREVEKEMYRDDD